jgi:hypothetical protein
VAGLGAVDENVLQDGKQPQISPKPDDISNVEDYNV